jgi:hypothetical protein
MPEFLMRYGTSAQAGGDNIIDVGIGNETCESECQSNCPGIRGNIARDMVANSDATRGLHRLLPQPDERRAWLARGRAL